MPRSKEGKKRIQIVKEDIERAVTAVANGDMSMRQACAVFSVKIGTLHRHIQIHRASNSISYEYKSCNAVKKVFSEPMEKELLNYIKQAALLHYGLTKKDVRELAFQYATVNELNYPHQWDETKAAGGQWMRHFLKKHGNEISLRKPQATSLARSTSFNKFNVEKFFENLKTAMLKYGPFLPHRIYNTDETGLTTVHVPPKILAAKGIKQVGSMTSGERGQNVTLIATINAVGNHIPPMFVFPRVHYKDFMIHGAPLGSKGTANPSGWSNESIFLEYLDHFILHARPSKEEPVLLLLDNHESHVNIPVIEKARSSGIVMVTFPPHTSHKLQPLDRTVFGSLKLHYNRAVNDWMSSNPGKALSIYDVAQMVGRAFPLSFTSSNILSGFSVSGISPLNQDIFSEDEFLSCYVSDRPNPTVDDSRIVQNPSRPSTSSSCGTVSPQEIRPFPKSLPRKEATRGRKRVRSRIITATPEEEEIELQKSNSLATKTKQVVKRKIVESEEENKINLCNDSSDEDTGIENFLSEQVAENIFEDNVDALASGTKTLKEVLHLGKVKRQIGEFVAFSYDDEIFPGEIIGFDDTGATIKAMKKSKKSWKWPEKEDILKYLWEDVLGSIKQPKKVSKRGFYDVPELNFF